MNHCMCNSYPHEADRQNATTKIESYVKVVESGMTDAERKKLEGIEDFANNYQLPIATDSTLGGFKVGTGLKMSKDGVLSVFQEVIDSAEIIDGGGAGGVGDEDGDLVIWDGGGAS